MLHHWPRNIATLAGLAVAAAVLASCFVTAADSKPPSPFALFCKPRLDEKNWQTVRAYEASLASNPAGEELIHLLAASIVVGGGSSSGGASSDTDDGGSTGGSRVAVVNAVSQRIVALLEHPDVMASIKDLHSASHVAFEVVQDLQRRAVGPPATLDADEVFDDM